MGYHPQALFSSGDHHLGLAEQLKWAGSVPTKIHLGALLQGVEWPDIATYCNRIGWLQRCYWNSTCRLGEEKYETTNWISINSNTIPTKVKNQKSNIKNQAYISLLHLSQPQSSLLSSSNSFFSLLWRTLIPHLIDLARPFFFLLIMGFPKGTSFYCVHAPTGYFSTRRKYCCSFCCGSWSLSPKCCFFRYKLITCGHPAGRTFKCPDGSTWHFSLLQEKPAWTNYLLLYILPSVLEGACPQLQTSSNDDCLHNMNSAVASWGRRHSQQTTWRHFFCRVCHLIFIFFLFVAAPCARQGQPNVAEVHPITQNIETKEREKKREKEKKSKRRNDDRSSKGCQRMRQVVFWKALRFELKKLWDEKKNKLYFFCFFFFYSIDVSLLP